MKKKITAVIFAISLFTMAFAMNPDIEQAESIALKNIFTVGTRTSCESENNLKFILTEYQRISREMTDHAIKYIEDPELIRIVKRQHRKQEKLLSELIASSDRYFLPGLAIETAKTRNMIEHFEESGKADYDYAEIMILHSRLGKTIGEAFNSKTGNKLKSNSEDSISAVRAWKKAKTGAWKKAQVALSSCGGAEF